MVIIPLLFVQKGYGTTEEIDSKFGDSPEIDGIIDSFSGEWNKATKTQINLGGLPPKGLPINFWVMQDEKNLYISIQFELEQEYHNATEFIGLLVSNSSSEDKEEFIDAKIIQFSNISINEFNYFDYFINNSIFSADAEIHGTGASNLNEDTSIYEFSIPIMNTDSNKEDAVLDYGNTYAFNITYGDVPIYPEGVKKSTVVLINISSLPSSLPVLTSIIMFILCVIVFSILGIIYGFYIYKVFKLKSNIKRIKR